MKLEELKRGRSRGRGPGRRGEQCPSERLARPWCGRVHVQGRGFRRSRPAPLLFLLADDPGDSRTVLAGLSVKKLLLRHDVKRCPVAEQKGLDKDALSFDALAQPWLDIVAECRATSTATTPGSIAFDTEDDA